MRTRFKALHLLGLLLTVGCYSGSDTLYPLGEGEKWTYQASARTKYATSPTTTTVTVTNMPKRDLAGKSVTPQKSEINGQTLFSFLGEDAEGIFLHANQAPDTVEPEVLPNPTYLLRRPYEKGAHWDVQTTNKTPTTETHGTLTATIQSVDEIVTVPAGTFEGCIQVITKGDQIRKSGSGVFMRQVNVLVEQIAWFCPGVGMVKSINTETIYPGKAAEERLESSLQLESHVDED